MHVRTPVTAATVAGAGEISKNLAASRDIPTHSNAQPKTCDPCSANPEWWRVASEEFAKRLGSDYQRPAPVPGRMDFFRVHAFTLDRLEEFLILVLPTGREHASPSGAFVWEGHHPDRPPVVVVNLLTGGWDEPGTGKGGRDLIGLHSHLVGIRPIESAKRLSAWLGISGVCNV